jgi:ABC-type lipoprotein release transport system permease subunit
VYGIVAFRASQRSREMAIRVALGASQGEIRNLVLGYGLRLAAGGTAIGLTVFGIASPVWKGRFFGVRPVDPMTIAGVAAVVLVVALGASLAPSRRASRAAPAELLREG